MALIVVYYIIKIDGDGIRTAKITKVVFQADPILLQSEKLLSISIIVEKHLQQPCSQQP